MKSKPKGKLIRCRDQSGAAAAVKVSLRNSEISIRVVEGDWAHLTLEQAMRLLDWLHDAIDEGYERERRRNWVSLKPYEPLFTPK